MHLLGLIHVVDDDASFRTAIQRRLQLAGYDVVTYSSAEDLLGRLPDDERPGCILLDVRLPTLSGPELQRHLGGLGPRLPIIFLSAYAEVQTAVKTIKAGADDFLVKPVKSELLLKAIEGAVARSEGLQRQRSTINALRAQLGTLTPRERQVFELVVRGKQNKQIARELGSTERTIKAHRQRVMEKMKVKSLAQLVSIAERLGILADASDNGSSDAPGDRALR
jgi:RNA polymerase sigma factor (sigma-70 family)